MWLKSLGVAALAALIAIPAFAQAPEGTLVRIRGKVEKLEGSTLMVKGRVGKDAASNVSVTLAPDAVVLGVKKIALSDIKQGDFIGSAAVPGKDGKLKAEEVLVFPEAARGTGEGHYPWDRDLKGSGETMTNATVSGIASAPKGQLLKVQYKGGEKDIAVGPKVPIVTFAPEKDKALLKAGATVFIPAVKKADGTLVANRVIAEKDHVKPPM
jgi:hypothetical protein